MEENKENTKTLSYDDIMRAIMKLPDKEKNVILTYFDLNKIASAISTEERFKRSMEECVEYANTWVTVSNALLKLYGIINFPDSATDDIVGDYERLDAPQKKETALKLLNNGDFQRDCCDILVDDMKRIVENDSTLKALDNLFGIIKHFKSYVRLGIGTDHKYEVKQ